MFCILAEDTAALIFILSLNEVTYWVLTTKLSAISLDKSPLVIPFPPTTICCPVSLFSLL